MQRQSSHLLDLIPQCRATETVLTPFLLVFCNVVGCTGRPYAWDCSTLQRTCDMHATHMQRDMQHDLFTCKLTDNVQYLVFSAPTPVLNGKGRFSRRGHFVGNWQESVCFACVLRLCCACVVWVLHVCCMCIALAGLHESHTWSGEVKNSVAGARVAGGRGETVEAGHLGYYIVVVARSIHLCGVEFLAYYTHGIRFGNHRR